MGIDLTKLKEKFDRKDAERSDRFSFQDGENYLRILPPSKEYLVESVDYISFEYLIHYNLGVEGDRKSEICPKSVDKKTKCPICEAVWKLYKTKTNEDKELATSLRAKTRHIFNVIDLNNLEKGIQVMETGPKIYEEIVKFITNPKWGDLLDIDKGRNFTITKTSAKETTSGYVEYNIAPDPDITSIREKLPKNSKEVISSLKKFIPTAKSYDDLKAILEGEEVSQEKKETKTSDTKEDEPIKEQPKEEKKTEPKPACFAKDYGPRRDPCVKCSSKELCRDEFLKLD